MLDFIRSMPHLIRIVVVCLLNVLFILAVTNSVRKMLEITKFKYNSDFAVFIFSLFIILLILIVTGVDGYSLMAGEQ